MGKPMMIHFVKTALNYIHPRNNMSGQRRNYEQILDEFENRVNTLEKRIKRNEGKIQILDVDVDDLEKRINGSSGTIDNDDDELTEPAIHVSNISFPYKVNDNFEVLALGEPVADNPKWQAQTKTPTAYLNGYTVVHTLRTGDKVYMRIAAPIKSPTKPVFQIEINGHKFEGDHPNDPFNGFKQV